MIHTVRPVTAFVLWAHPNVRLGELRAAVHWVISILTGTFNVK